MSTLLLLKCSYCGCEEVGGLYAEVHKSGKVLELKGQCFACGKHLEGHL